MNDGEKRIESRIDSLIDQSRVANFSDGVFAFAATLLVVKLDLPQVFATQAGVHLSDLIATMWPEYLANIISFLVIGYYWLNHHAIFSMVKRYNITVVWLNIAFLITLSFIPFPVDVYGDFPNVPWVVVFYSGSLAIVGYFLTILWMYASHKHRLISQTMSSREINYYTVRNLIAPVVFTLSIPLVYIHPVLAQLSWVLVLVGIMMINRIFGMHRLTQVEKTSL